MFLGVFDGSDCAIWVDLKGVVIILVCVLVIGYLFFRLPDHMCRLNVKTVETILNYELCRRGDFKFIRFIGRGLFGVLCY